MNISAFIFLFSLHFLNAGNICLFQIMLCSDLFIILDFIYADFNETTGLVINGDAGTTVCSDNSLVIIFVTNPQLLYSI